MARVSLARKVLIFSIIMLYILSAYVSHGFSQETLMYGLSAIVFFLLLISAIITRPYVGRSDGVAAIVLSIVAVLLGSVTGILIGGENILASSLYTLTVSILLLGIAYGISKYLV